MLGSVDGSLLGDISIIFHVLKRWLLEVILGSVKMKLNTTRELHQRFERSSWIFIMLEKRQNGVEIS